MLKLYDCCWRSNRMIHALWRHWATVGHAGADPNKLIGKPPRAFASRIKKFKNLDRRYVAHPMLDDAPDDQWAFYDQPGEGTGSEERFSVFHAFTMGIALRLFELGWNQSDCIFVVKYARDHFEDVFSKIHAKKQALAPVTDTSRSLSFHRHYPESYPFYPPDGSRKPVYAEYTVWALIRRFETTQIHPGFRQKTENSNQEIPLHMPPEFCYGLEDLKKTLFDHPELYQYAVLMELADLARSLPRFLAQAPDIGRGRPFQGEQR